MIIISKYSDFLIALEAMVDAIEADETVEVEAMRAFCDKWGRTENQPFMTPIENIQYIFIMDSLLNTVEKSDEWEEMLEMEGAS